MVISIQPVQSWNKGQTTQLNCFRLQSINDNLKDSCTFYWQIGNEVPVQPSGTAQTWVQDGNLTMSGSEYAGWDGTNTAAFDWALAKLNLQRTQSGTIASTPTLKLNTMPQ